MSPPERVDAPLTPEAATTLVRAWCSELGFDDVGVADARRPMAFADEIRAAFASGRHGPLAWLAEGVGPRTDANVFLDGARSVVVTVTNYHHGSHRDHVGADAESAALVSRYAWGSDYHNVIRRRLRKLRKRLLERAPGARISPFVDDKPISERAWATMAGLGFIGKSTMLIHRKLGTWTFIGGLVTDLALAPTSDTVPADLCGTCTRCIDACPTGALAPFTLDVARCLTTWNVEEPGDPRGDADALRGHGWAVGCDVCQEVCPWNRFARPSSEPRFAPRAGHVALTADAIPDDLEGTPLARPGADGLAHAVARALPRRGGRR